MTKVHRMQHPSSLNGHTIRSRGIGSAVPDGTGPVERVLGERARQSLLTRDFLTANEAVDGDSDGAVDVGCVTVFREAHLGEGL
jgi:hypothetical protein